MVTEVPTPVIVTSVSTAPSVGEKLDTTGVAGAGAGTSTVKFVEEVPVRPFTVTLIEPVRAPLGTNTVREVVLAEVGTAGSLKAHQKNSLPVGNRCLLCPQVRSSTLQEAISQ